ncbi:MAG: phosphatase PAP2 family protein [Spirochaetes bacterium]|nr:phosphatase PAP2 family protein [Spirochaetota bacterium]
MIQNFFSPAWKPLMDFLSEFAANAPGYIIILLFIYFCIDRKFGLRLFLFMVISDALNRLLKTVFMQPRPFQINNNVKIYFNPETKHLGYGMPSGHAQSSVVIYGTLFYHIKKTLFRIFIILILAGIALSRLYLGAHSIFQVLSGLITGLLTLFFLIKYEKKILDKVIRLRPLVFSLISLSSGILFLFTVLSV